MKFFITNLLNFNKVNKTITQIVIQISILFFGYQAIFLFTKFISTILFNEINFQLFRNSSFDTSFESFFKLIIFLPLLEEILFRLPLRLKIKNLLIAFCALVYLGISKILSSDISDLSLTNLIGIAIPLFFYFLMCHIKFLARHLEESIYLSKKSYKVFFCTMALTFAYLHLFNFELNSKTLILSPIIILPNLIFALFMGYIRLKFGFIYAVSTHVMNNTIPFIVIYFLNLS